MLSGLVVFITNPGLLKKFKLCTFSSECVLPAIFFFWCAVWTSFLVSVVTETSHVPIIVIARV